MHVVPVSWVLVAIAAAIGGGLFWRGAKVVGAALLVGAAVLAFGLTDVAARDGADGVSAADRHDGSWVLRAHLAPGTTTTVAARLATGWVEVPGVGSADVEDGGTVLVTGDPRSGLMEMTAVRTALRATPQVESVERVD